MLNFITKQGAASAQTLGVIGKSQLDPDKPFSTMIATDGQISLVPFVLPLCRFLLLIFYLRLLINDRVYLYVFSKVRSEK